LVATLAVTLSLAIGITCSLMPCCIGMYPGLFAYLQSNLAKPSRIRAAFMSLGFASGILLAVLAISTAFMLLRIEVMDFMNQGMFYIDIAGFALLGLIGVSYLRGRSIGLSLPGIGGPPPAALMSLRGYLAAPIYGVYFGGPGAAHCTIILVIPIIFLSLSAQNPSAFLTNFGMYAIGRVIPIVVIGMMLQDAQLRFLKLVSRRSALMNRLIGVLIILSGISLFFVR